MSSTPGRTRSATAPATMSAQPPPPRRMRSRGPARPRTCRRSTASRCRSKISSMWPAGPPPIGPGRAEVRGRGVRAARQDHHLRVRHPARHREPSPGHLPQPGGPRPHARRVIQRRGRRRRRRHGAHRPRRRRRRADPDPRVVHRPGRAQTHPRPGHQPHRQPRRPRHQRRAHPDGGRHRGRPGRARPPRPGRVVVTPHPPRPFATAATMDPPTGLRIGVLAGSPAGGLTVHPACAAAADTTVSALAPAGHHLLDTPLPLPPPGDLTAAFTTIWNPGGAGIALTDPDRAEPHNRALRDAAQTTSSWAHAQAMTTTQQLSRRTAEGFLASLDLLLTPTMARLPPPIGAWKPSTGTNPTMAPANSYPMAVSTSLFNLTGQPAISIPTHHHHATGPPAGVQIAAAPRREDLLPQTSHTLELAHPWTDRRPATS